MTAFPIPVPRTAGGRPPFEPPKKTTFDSSPGDEGDPLHKVYADSVRHLLKHLDSSAPDQLPVVLTLIQLRRKSIERELRFERLLGFDTLPPLLVDFHSLEDMFEEDEVISTYKRLLDDLQQAEEKVLAKMRDLNIELPASEL